MGILLVYDVTNAATCAPPTCPAQLALPARTLPASRSQSTA
jgi:hypothetical protein